MVSKLKLNDKFVYGRRKTYSILNSFKSSASNFTFFNDAEFLFQKRRNDQTHFLTNFIANMVAEESFHSPLGKICSSKAN